MGSTLHLKGLHMHNNRTYGGDGASEPCPPNGFAGGQKHHQNGQPAAQSNGHAEKTASKPSPDPALDHAPWAASFLTALSHTGNMRKACEFAKVGRLSVVERINKNPSFHAAFARAWAEAVDKLEAKAWERAMEKSDRLMTFLLSSLRPEVYGPKPKASAEESPSVADAALSLADDENAE